jgi:hypothetical protein
MEMADLILDARALLSDVTDLSYTEADMLTWANLACADMSGAGMVNVESSTQATYVDISNCLGVMNVYYNGVPLYHSELGETDFLSPSGGSAPTTWNWDGTRLRFDDNDTSTVKYLYRKRLSNSEYDLDENSTIAAPLAAYSNALAYYIAYRALLADRDPRAGQYFAEYQGEKMIAAGLRGMNDQGPDEVKI